MNKEIPGKQLAIIGYLSALLMFVHILLAIAVLVTALILHMGKNLPFASFHLRQMVGITLIAILVNTFAEVIPAGLALLIVGLFVLTAMLGLVSALRNQMIPLPFIGKHFQQWFSFIK